MFLLVTDQGYECEPDIVWERLDSVNGDTTYCTGSFTPFVPHRYVPVAEFASYRVYRIKILVQCWLEPGRIRHSVASVGTASDLLIFTLALGGLYKILCCSIRDDLCGS